MYAKSRSARLRTLVNAEAKKFEQWVKQPSERLEVKGVEVDEIAKGGHHGCADPELLLGHVAGSEGRKDREQDLLTNRVPEVGPEGGTVRLECAE